MSLALQLPQLRADQYAIAMHPAKRKNLAMGRRWGKTVLGGVITANIVRQHGRVAWVVPTYKNSRAPWRWLVLAFQNLAQRKIVDISKSERVITTHRGGFLGIYSADNIDAIRGEWFHAAINDECAFISEEAITDAIEPTLADADGELINIGTPKGKNWFWRAWLRGIERMDQEEASWTAPTSANPNPNIRRAAQLVQGRVSERTYRQEWLAQFVDESGGVFRNVRACATAPQAPPRSGGHQYTMGVDWGKVNDRTVFSVYDMTVRQQVAVDIFNEVDYPVQRQRLAALAAEWRPLTILAEANSMGQPIIDELQREGLPVQGFMTTNPSKATLIESLALAFEQKSIGILDTPTQINELEAFEMGRTPSGMPKYSAPPGLHDDTVMALALAYAAGDGDASGWSAADLAKLAGKGRL